MAVSYKRVYGFTINIESTNSKNFKLFMEKIISNLSQNEIKNSGFFMDNLSSHKTCELYEFYKKYNLKILFNSPYQSSFNMIEYCFRYIKNNTYKKLYEELSDLMNDVEEIIKSENFKEYLEKFFWKLY